MEPKAKQSPESVVREIKRRTRRKFNSEEKIRIILEGLRGEDSIANICRKEGIAPGIYYKWRSSITCQPGIFTPITYSITSVSNCYNEAL